MAIHSEEKTAIYSEEIDLNEYFYKYYSTIIDEVKNNKHINFLINKSLVFQKRIKGTDIFEDIKDDIYREVVSKTFLKFDKYLNKKRRKFKNEKHVFRSILTSKTSVIIDTIRSLGAREDHLKIIQEDIRDWYRLYDMINNPDDEYRLRIDHTRKFLEEKDSNKGKFMEELLRCLSKKKKRPQKK